MSSRNAKRRAGYEHAWPVDIASLDSIPQRDIGIPIRAYVANGGESRQQRLASAFDSSDGRARHRDAQGLIAVPGGIRGEMHMYVDQAGQAGGVWKLDDLRAGWNREIWTDALDFVGSGEDDSVVDQTPGL